MEKKRDSRYSPRDLAQIVGDAQRKAIDNKLATNQKLLPEEEAFVAAETSRLDVEKAKTAKEILKTYALRYPNFERFFSALGRTTKKILANARETEKEKLKDAAIKFGTELHVLPNISSEEPAYKAILDAIISDCTLSEKDSEEIAKTAYEKYIQQTS